MKKFILFIIIALSMQACHRYEDNSNFYLNKERDMDLIGVWASESSEGLSYEEYTNDGKIYRGSDKDGNGIVIWNKDIIWPYCWYTDDGYIHIYRYSGKWSKALESKYEYYLSENKDTLHMFFFEGHQGVEYSRVNLPE